MVDDCAFFVSKWLNARARPNEKRLMGDKRALKMADACASKHENIEMCRPRPIKSVTAPPQLLVRAKSPAHSPIQLWSADRSSPP